MIYAAWPTPVLLPIRSADLALHDTGALAAAEYGRPAVCAHSPLFFRAGRRLYHSWTVHQMLVLHLDRWLNLVLIFKFLFITRILCLCSILVFPEKSDVCSSRSFFVCFFVAFLFPRFYEP